MQSLPDLQFDNSFARLPAVFHSRVRPMPLAGAHMISVSPAAAGPVDASLRDGFSDRAILDAWVADYRTRLKAEQRDDVSRRAAMHAVNPRYVLRNYLVQQAIEQAEQGDFGEIDRLLALLSCPFEDQPGMQAYAQEPPDWGRHIEVSCSS